MKKKDFNVVDVMSNAITTTLSTAKLSHSCAVIKGRGWGSVVCEGLPQVSPPLRSSLRGWCEWGCWKKVSCVFTSGWSSCQMWVSLYVLPLGWQQAGLQALLKKQKTQSSWGYFSCQVSCSLPWNLKKNSPGLSYPGSMQASFPLFFPFFFPLGIIHFSATFSYGF